MPATETTVREIALENPASIRVFEKFGIDYCCGGHKALTQACRERALERVRYWQPSMLRGSRRRSLESTGRRWGSIPSANTS